LSRVLRGSAGDENGEFSSELSVEVDAVDDGGNDNVDRGRNCPREFLKGVEASVIPQKSGILKSSL
jgi:hypothetical protein